MPIIKVQQFKVVGPDKKVYIFEDEGDAIKYDALISETGLRDKILKEIIPDIVAYLKARPSGEKAVARDWSILAFWEFFKRGFPLPTEVKSEDWFVPKEIKELKKTVADNPAPGDQLGDDDEMPKGRETTKTMGTKG